MSHSEFLQQTFNLASHAVKKGNHPFGAVLVHQGKVIFSSENTVVTGKDITAHAELNLIREASQIFSEEVLSECILYSSTEPCCMCSGAIYWSGISRVIYGCSNAELCDVVGGSLELSSKEIFKKGVRAVQSEQLIELKAQFVEQHILFFKHPDFHSSVGRVVV